MKPLVTALVDTFNHESFIGQALESVFDQGLSPAELEIIVIDDGSTDRTPTILQKFSPRIRHLRKKNGGQASAFNAALPEIHGEIVALLDGDDWWRKDKLATVLAAFEKRPELSAIGHGLYRANTVTDTNAVFAPAADTFINLDTPEAAGAAFLHWGYLPTSCLTVKREIFERVIPIPDALVFSADSPICMSAMAAGILILAEPLTYYRQHESNLFAVDSGTPVASPRLRRKFEIDELMFEILYPTLSKLGVRPDCAAALLDSVSIDSSRSFLRIFGGKRTKTFRTEMRFFRSTSNHPGFAYRFFKHVFVGAAAFALPPQTFYRFRDWYARHNIGILRDRFFRAGSAPTKSSHARSPR